MIFEVDRGTGHDVLTFFLPGDVSYSDGILTLPVELEGCTYNGEPATGLLDGSRPSLDGEEEGICTFIFFLRSDSFLIQYLYHSHEDYCMYWGIEGSFVKRETSPRKSFSSDTPLSLLFETIPIADRKATV